MLDLDLRSILKCVRCGACRSVCPVLEEVGWESAGARGRILVAHGISQGLDVDADVLESLNTCMTCGMCKQMCPAGANPTYVIENTRRQLVMRGEMTEAQRKLNERIMESGNSLGEVSDRRSWLSEYKGEIKETAGYVYFVGCLGAYRYPESVVATFDVLSRFDVTILPDEICCGSPLIRTGFDVDELIAHNIEQMRKVGAHTFITSCAGCHNTLIQSYPDEFEVMHVSEFLEQHLPELQLRRLKLTVTYHDACHLGRCRGVFDAPRRVIEAVCDLKEMKTNRENARCCGGGGGVRTGYPDLSLALAKKRLEEIPDGVDYLITSCPLCTKNLIEGGSDTDVLDLVELVRLAIE
ncbi:MAG TPA: 4Fe-4S dicluster domain-containing protein [Methanosarcinaceae archaeon]|nr:4Fe-4S dicluster domain-containing protein [Methanosarcinaceae archaeon]